MAISLGSLCISHKPYFIPFSTSYSSCSLLLSLNAGMVFACCSREHNLSLALLICGGYSWFTYRPGGSLLLFCISWSLSSLLWNVTDMGLVWFGLYLPVLVQFVILVFSAILLLHTRSSSLVFVCADAMVLNILCFVVSYGSHCCSGIPVKMTLLHSWVD